MKNTYAFPDYAYVKGVIGRGDSLDAVAKRHFIPYNTMRAWWAANNSKASKAKRKAADGVALKSASHPTGKKVGRPKINKAAVETTSITVNEKTGFISVYGEPDYNTIAMLWLGYMDANKLLDYEAPFGAEHVKEMLRLMARVKNA